MLCLLPFERGVYDEAGLRSIFVGHPLADQLPLGPTAMPRGGTGPCRRRPYRRGPAGQPDGEVSRLAADFAGTVARLAARRPGLRFVAARRAPKRARTFEAALAVMRRVSG